MVQPCDCELCARRYRLFWTSVTTPGWNTESELTLGTTGISLERLLQRVEQIEGFAPNCRYGPEYDWRVEEA